MRESIRQNLEVLFDESMVLTVLLCVDVELLLFVDLIPWQRVQFVQLNM